MVFIFQGIPTEDHKTDGNRSENGNNDDPDNGIMDLFCLVRVNIENGATNKKENKSGTKNQPDDAKIFFKSIHTKGLNF